MSRLTIDEVQSRVASRIDQDETTGNISSSDYSLRLKYINMAQTEWAEAYQWQTLYDEYNVLVSTSTGNASIALPNDFRRLASFPWITYDGTNTEKFSEVLPQNDAQYSSTDKRVWILGNPNNTYTLRVFGTTLASGASVKVPYYKSPMSLASPADVSAIPDAQFLVQRTIAHLWEAREDPRFEQAKAEAQQILQNMLEYENVFGQSLDDRVKTIEESRYNFRIGDV
jgi:hypothetical protein